MFHQGYWSATTRDRAGQPVYASLGHKYYDVLPYRLLLSKEGAFYFRAVDWNVIRANLNKAFPHYTDIWNSTADAMVAVRDLMREYANGRRPGANSSAAAQTASASATLSSRY